MGVLLQIFFHTTSSKVYKEDIKTLEKPEKILDKVNGYEYKFKNKKIPHLD